MHQPITAEIAHCPANVSDQTPFVDMPFFDWLCNHPNPDGKYMHTMAEYLCPGYSSDYVLASGMLHGTMPGSEYEIYRHAHSHYWTARLKWSAATRRKNLRADQAAAIQQQIAAY